MTIDWGRVSPTTQLRLAYAANGTALFIEAWHEITLGSGWGFWPVCLIALAAWQLCGVTREVREPTEKLGVSGKVFVYAVVAMVAAHVILSARFAALVGWMP